VKFDNENCCCGHKGGVIITESTVHRLFSLSHNLLRCTDSECRYRDLKYHKIFTHVKSFAAEIWSNDTNYATDHVRISFLAPVRVSQSVRHLVNQWTNLKFVIFRSKCRNI